MSLFHRKSILGFLVVGLVVSPEPAYAGSGDVYGYGSRASALGNTLLGGSNGAYATFYNPAANSARPGVGLSLAAAYAHPKFKEIHGVTIENSATTAQGGTVTGDVDTEGYLDHLSQAVGFSYNFGEKWRSLALGILGSMPLGRFSYLDTGEPFKPEYYNYRATTQRPELFASLGFAAARSLHAGAGVKFAANVASSANYTVSGSAGTVSHGRMTTTVKPSAAPYVSVFYDPKYDAPSHPSPSWTCALTVRAPARYRLDVDVRSNARVLGPTNDFPIVFDSSSTLYYDPLEADLAASLEPAPRWWITLELDWLNTSAYQAPTVSVVDTGSAIQLKNSVSSTPSMRDIFVPKLGVERRWNATTARAGYFWRPSPITDNSGSGNLVDPEKHVFTAGVGFDLKKARVSERAIVVDLHGQYHWLVSQRITKSPGNEAGSAGQGKVGSPGYDIGGAVYGGGLSVSMLF
ncbi:MAG: hypothetical protein HYW49_12755 [Deltaproteobacteria bacterium]|nr:hypothetical protein [Deltaproteobacteria bacterium]